MKKSALLISLIYLVSSQLVVAQENNKGHEPVCECDTKSAMVDSGWSYYSGPVVTHGIVGAVGVITGLVLYHIYNQKSRMVSPGNNASVNAAKTLLAVKRFATALKEDSASQDVNNLAEQLLDMIGQSQG